MATYGDMLREISACTTEEEASAFVQKETDEVLKLRPELVREQARRIVMENIGYLTGYMDRDEADRLLRLFATRHPFLGGPGEWPTDPEDVFALGKKVAAQKGRA